jgi:pimeloyl-ACP methyl ester carboxylesterase
MNRFMVGIAVLVTAVALFAATRHQTFTYVSVDGRMLRMLVSGSGPATVVFENGLGGPLENWGKVQPDVSRFAKTVSYDRAGAGLSDHAPRPRDGRVIARELHRALQLAHVVPPYVLVGASLGGPYIRVFAGTYPNVVSAIVLVDPTPDAEAPEGNVTGFPELESLPATLDQARTSQLPRGIPVFLIDAVSPMAVPFASDAIRRARLKQRAEIAAESVSYKAWIDTIPEGRLIATHESGHNVAQEQPGIIVETIRQVVQLTQRR